MQQCLRGQWGIPSASVPERALVVPICVTEHLPEVWGAVRGERSDEAINKLGFAKPYIKRNEKKYFTLWSLPSFQPVFFCVRTQLRFARRPLGPPACSHPMPAPAPTAPLPDRCPPPRPPVGSKPRTTGGAGSPEGQMPPAGTAAEPSPQLPGTTPSEPTPSIGGCSCSRGKRGRGGVRRMRGDHSIHRG